MATNRYQQWQRRTLASDMVINGGVYAQIHEYQVVCNVQTDELPRELCWDESQVRRNGFRSDPSE